MLKERLQQLSKSELIDLVIHSAKRDSKLKQDLLLQFAVNEKVSVDQLLKSIDSEFRNMEYEYNSTSKIARELWKIIKQIERANLSIKIRVYWEIVDRVLYKLNEYGMDDTAFEDIAINTMDLLVNLFQTNPDLADERDEIRAKLIEYSQWGNCGITDYIEDTIENLDENK